MKKGAGDVRYAPTSSGLSCLQTWIDMLLMAEKGIRGGITQAVKRYVKVNNKYMKDLYNPDEESMYLQYLDASNLYGWAMVQNYQQMDSNGRREKTLPLKKIDELVEKRKEGYLLEFVVKYPKGLYKNHNKLLFLTEKMKIGRVEKLVPNLKDKKR